MEPIRIGPLRVRVAGGSDDHGGGDGPAVILCHGFGASGDDLVGLAHVVPAGPAVRWFFPEAPLALGREYGPTARAWWPIDFARREALLARGQQSVLCDETPEQLADARAALEACIDALVREHGVLRSRLVLGGFSQGAMLSTEVALHAAEPFAGVALLSGTLVSAPRWRKAAERTGPALKVLQAHGRADPLLPFEGAEALRRLLEDAGADVEWIAHAGQHEIPDVVVQGLGAFLRVRLAPSAI